MQINIPRIVKALIVLVVLFVFVFFWPVNLYHKTSTPEFCASCHVMETQHDAWVKTAVHRNIDCIECHLPYTNPVSHFAWKGYDGMKDVIFFYGRLYEDPIETSVHGIKTVQKNCERCHADMISMITVNDRNCWSCHRRMNHNFPNTYYEIVLSQE